MSLPLHDQPSSGIYVLWATGTAQFKIGYSANIPRRRRALQQQNAVRLRLIDLLPYAPPDLARMEQFFHTVFAPYRSHGEWFTFVFPQRACHDLARHSAWCFPPGVALPGDQCPWHAHRAPDRVPLWPVCHYPLCALIPCWLALSAPAQARLVGLVGDARPLDWCWLTYTWPLYGRLLRWPPVWQLAQLLFPRQAWTVGRGSTLEESPWALRQTAVTRWAEVTALAAAMKARRLEG